MKTILVAGAFFTVGLAYEQRLPKFLPLDLCEKHVFVA